MPPPRHLNTLTNEERITLRRARNTAALGTIAFGMATALFVAALAGSAYGHDTRGVLPIVAMLGAGWVWFLRRMPFRLRGALLDLRQNGVDVMRGVAAVRQRRGIGLFAPTRSELLLEGHTFGLVQEQAANLREGTLVEARIAPVSKVLLSIAPVTRAAVASLAATVDAEAAATFGLTAREIALLRLIASGHADKHIARELGLEPATVRTYNSQLYAKLDVRRRTEAVARAHALGLTTNVND